MRRVRSSLVALAAVVGLSPGVVAQGDTITVSADGASDHTTIGAAVEAASPVISGNTICAGREPLKLHDGASPQLGTNEICEVTE